MILDEIKKLAEGRDVIIGGDFNLTVSHWPRSRRPVSKQDLAIQARLADEFELLAGGEPGPAITSNASLDRGPHHPLPLRRLVCAEGMEGRLQSCVVLSGDDWNRLSDHNPVIACFS